MHPTDPASVPAIRTEENPVGRRHLLECGAEAAAAPLWPGAQAAGAPNAETRDSHQRQFHRQVTRPTITTLAPQSRSPSWPLCASCLSSTRSSRRPRKRVAGAWEDSRIRRRPGGNMDGEDGEDGAALPVMRKDGNPEGKRHKRAPSLGGPRRSSAVSLPVVSYCCPEVFCAGCRNSLLSQRSGRVKIVPVAFVLRRHEKLQFYSAEIIHEESPKDEQQNIIFIDNVPGFVCAPMGPLPSRTTQYSQLAWASSVETIVIINKNSPVNDLLITLGMDPLKPCGGGSFELKDAVPDK